MLLPPAPAPPAPSSTGQTTRQWRWLAAAAGLALLAPLAPWLVRRAGDDDAFAGLAIQALAVAVGIGGARAGPSPLVGRAWLWLGVGTGALLTVASVALDVRMTAMVGALLLVGALVAALAPRYGGLAVLVTLLACVSQPLAGDLDVVGFPARLFAAWVAKAALGVFGVVVGGAEAVLVVEGNVADVEAPCAGMATLRMLVVVVLAVAALRRASVGRGLVAVVAACAVGLLGNAVRVTVLAALVLVAEQPLLAELVHVPLGVLVFGAAVLVADRVVRGAVNVDVDGADAARVARRVVFVVSVVAALASAARVIAWSSSPPSPRAERALAASTTTMTTTTTTTTTIAGALVPLTPAEVALFGRHAHAAHKQRVVVDGVDVGSLLLVSATSARAHHSPERCLAGAGLRVDASVVRDVGGVTVKVLTLDGGARAAVSFYVRDDGGAPRVLPGLLDRLLDQARHRHGRWMFVSLVVDAPLSPAGTAATTATDEAVAALVPQLVSLAHTQLVAQEMP